MHAIIATHTPRHLRRTLLGVLAQSTRPTSITVTCDSDDPAIADVVRELAREPIAHTPTLLIQRPHQGESRSSQVRNNAVRALLERGHAETDLLWFLDGDCIPAPDCLATVRSLSSAATIPAPRSPLVIAFRIDLTPEQTDAITDAAILDADFVTPTPDQLAALARRHRRYRRHALTRRLGLGKPHKPKLLSANFGVTLREYVAVNGFDETYTGYGQEDDDLGRRLYAIGVRPAIAVATARAYHQYHPTRAPGAWEASPNAARFAQPFTPRCERGLADPAAQPSPVVRLISPSA